MIRLEWTLRGAPPSHYYPVGTKNEKVIVRIEDEEQEWFEAIRDRILSLEPCPERTALIGEVCTIMEMKALLDAKYAQQLSPPARAPARITSATVVHTLSEVDKDEARRAAKARFERHSTRNTPHKYGKADGRTLDYEVWHVGSEIAVSRVLGREWNDSADIAKDRDEGDLGDGIGVRATEHANGSLILHREDADHHRFVLARGKFPTYEVGGWVTALEGKAEKFWPGKNPHRPCFMVPPSALHGLDRLVA